MSTFRRKIDFLGRIMTISVKEVHTVATLARIAITEEHAVSLTEDLAKILGYVRKLDELDTSEVPPTAQVTVQNAPLRPDVRREGVSKEAALASAPRADKTGFLVPQFVDES